MQCKLLLGISILLVVGCWTKAKDNTPVSSSDSPKLSPGEKSEDQKAPSHNSTPSKIDFANLKPFTVESAQSDEMVTLFGTSNRSRIDNAQFLLFSEGRYIDGPYTPRHNGLAILVNDIVLTNVMWPADDYVGQRPEIPTDVTAISTFDSMAKGKRLVDTWLNRVERHFASTSAPGDINRNVAEAVRELPFVETIKEHSMSLDWAADSRPQFTITTKRGEKFDVNLGLSTRRPETVDAIRSGIKVRLDDLELWIKRGGLVSHFGNHIKFIPNESPTWYRLPRMFETLDSEGTREEKVGIVMATFADIISPSDPYSVRFADRFVQTYRGSEQLRKRLRVIRASSKGRHADGTMRPTVVKLPESVIKAEIGKQTEDADNQVRTEWRTAVVDMIHLLESGEIEEYVRRYTNPIRQHEWLENPESRQATIDSLRKTKLKGASYLRRVLQQEPVISDDKRTVIVTIFVDIDGYREYVFTKFGIFWYRG